MAKYSEREALDLIRATATRSFPECINLPAIDRILADVATRPTPPAATGLTAALAALVAAREAATAGPWARVTPLQIIASEEITHSVDGPPCDFMFLRQQADADFIAAAGSLDLPALLAYVRELEARAANANCPAGWVLVPATPSHDALVSMATRHSHDYGLQDNKRREAMRASMAQLYEEATGQGFYKLPTPPDAH